MGKVFGREPAVILGAFSALVQIVTAFGIKVDPQTQSIVTAVVAAALGLYVAVKVHDGLYPGILGFVQAGTALVAYFWLHWDTATQGKFLAAVAVLVGIWVRDKVTAPVPATVSPAGKLIAPVA